MNWKEVIKDLVEVHKDARWPIAELVKEMTGRGAKTNTVTIERLLRGISNEPKYKLGCELLAAWRLLKADQARENGNVD